MTIGRDYTQLPEQVALDSTVTGKDDRPLQDPDDLRSLEQLLGVTEN